MAKLTPVLSVAALVGKTVNMVDGSTTTIKSKRGVYGYALDNGVTLGARLLRLANRQLTEVSEADNATWGAEVEDTGKGYAQYPRRAKFTPYQAPVTKRTPSNGKAGGKKVEEAEPVKPVKAVPVKPAKADKEDKLVVTEFNKKSGLLVKNAVAAFLSSMLPDTEISVHVTVDGSTGLAMHIEARADKKEQVSRDQMIEDLVSLGAGRAKWLSRLSDEDLFEQWNDPEIQEQLEAEAGEPEAEPESLDDGSDLDDAFADDVSDLSDDEQEDEDGEPEAEDDSFDLSDDDDEPEAEDEDEETDFQMEEEDSDGEIDPELIDSGDDYAYVEVKAEDLAKADTKMTKNPKIRAQFAAALDIEADDLTAGLLLADAEEMQFAFIGFRPSASDASKPMMMLVSEDTGRMKLVGVQAVTDNYLPVLADGDQVQADDADDQEEEFFDEELI